MLDYAADAALFTIFFAFFYYLRYHTFRCHALLSMIFFRLRRYGCFLPHLFLRLFSSSSLYIFRFFILIATPPSRFHAAATFSASP